MEKKYGWYRRFKIIYSLFLLWNWKKNIEQLSIFNKNVYMNTLEKLYSKKTTEECLLYGNKIQKDKEGLNLMKSDFFV